MEIPLIGLGTWELSGKECVRVVKEALDVGYRHIDTAFSYENHKEVAKGIEGFNREKLFITTKLAIGLDQIDDGRIDQSVEKACDQALLELKTDYLDLLLIHWPDRKRPIEKILAAMHKLVDKQKIHAPGVSNYTEHHLQDAYDAHVKVPFNQVEMHPYLNQHKLLSFCHKHGTRLIAYRPFGKGQLLKKEPLLKEVGQNYDKTAAQVVLRWFIQKNVPTIPKASSRDHLEENLAVWDFALTGEEMAKLDNLNRDFRYCVQDWAEFDY